MIDFDALLHGPTMAVFGEAVIYTPKARIPLTITGVFDRAYLQQTPLGSGSQEPLRAGSAGNIVNVKPVLGVQLSQFYAPPEKGDVLQVVASGLMYYVQEVRPDGHGWALLHLTKWA